MSSISLLNALFSRTQQAILKELFTREDARLHLRELERLTGLNSGGLRRVLANFTEAGLVITEKSGNRIYYKADSRSPLYPELKMLTVKTVGIADLIHETLLPFAKEIELAYIYGSVADGTFDSSSDVDLLIVGYISLRKLAGPLAKAAIKISREINTSTYSAAEYMKELETKGSFIQRIGNGPRIMIIGKTNEPG